VAATDRLTGVRPLAGALVRGLVLLGVGAPRTSLPAVPGRSSGRRHAPPVIVTEAAFRLGGAVPA
jgi:hypothetical protein